MKRIHGAKEWVRSEDFSHAGVCVSLMGWPINAAIPKKTMITSADEKRTRYTGKRTLGNEPSIRPCPAMDPQEGNDPCGSFNRHSICLQR